MRSLINSQFPYAKSRGVWSYPVLFYTRWLRCHQSLNFLRPKERHLDIGCGDGYFLNKSPCKKKYGLDELYDNKFHDHLNFPDKHFDYVTMLAVIEHFEEPQKILSEVHRVLKDDGHFIVTTPKRASERLINLYVKGIENDHHHYYDKASLTQISPELFDFFYYKTFLFGFNQICCYNKKI